MPHPDGSGWLLNYADPRNDTRMLMSLPSAMLCDLHLLAELKRRAAQIKERPEITASFKTPNTRPNALERARTRFQRFSG